MCRYYAIMSTTKTRKAEKQMNNSVDYYMDMETGEITENHNEAVEWSRHGVKVGLFKNGKLRMIW